MHLVGAAVHVHVCLAAVPATMSSPVLLDAIDAAVVGAVLTRTNALEESRAVVTFEQ